MGAKMDLTGQTYGRFKVLFEIETHYTAKGAKVRKWKCLCECGRAAEIRMSDLRSGRSQSCGCLVVEKSREVCRAKITHGMSKAPEYTALKDAIRRCYNSDNKWYSCYGGRGISVCDEWRDTLYGPVRFLEHIGPRPNGLSLDRIDNDGNYKPGNVRWATPTQQTQNRRKRNG